MKILILLLSTTSLSLCYNITNILDNSPNEVHINEEEAKWKINAIRKLWDERIEMGHTPLVKYSPPGFPNADIFIKNETATKTRNLKHRFAWALMLWAITEGKVNSKTSAVYESTSGNTGSAEAYMCKLVGVPYVAVVAENLEEEKVKQIEKFGGQILKVKVNLRNQMAIEKAETNGGFYMNQFGNAEKAEEIHESGNFYYESTNVYHEIINQLKADKDQQVKVPDYFVHSAGTGGTISSVGRYIIRYGAPTRVLLSDSQYSLFYDYVVANEFTNQTGNGIWKAPGIAGVGYGYASEPVLFGNSTSLVREVIHETMKIPDIASVAGCRVLNEMGYNVGPSTALNFLTALQKIYLLRNKPTAHRLTFATLACDPGDFYKSTYLNDEWVESNFNDRGGTKAMNCWKEEIKLAMNTGSNFYVNGLRKCH